MSDGYLPGTFMVRDRRRRQLWRDRLSLVGGTVATIVALATLVTLVWYPGAKHLLWILAGFWAVVIPAVFWIEYVYLFDRGDPVMVEDQWRILDVSRNIWAGLGLLLLAYLAK